MLKVELYSSMDVVDSSLVWFVIRRSIVCRLNYKLHKEKVKGGISSMAKNQILSFFFLMNSLKG